MPRNRSSQLEKLEKDLGLGGLAKHMEAAIAGSADPSAAARLVPEVLGAIADEKRLHSAWRRRPVQVCRVLAKLCGAAPFFAPHLSRHPDWIPALAAEKLAISRSREDYERLLATAAAAGKRKARSDLLRDFKYYELARITVRELSPDLVPPDQSAVILAELSHLADTLLEAALGFVLADMGEKFGPPGGSDDGDGPLRFCVLGLGKLGGEELNYSSDVDLIYVHETPPDTWEGSADGDRALDPAEYYSRAARDFGQLVSTVTENGFLYRIDLDLRPEGRSGPLVISDAALTAYYDGWAATWEKAAFMKARPVAGDTLFGWHVIRAIDPMIYRSSMDLGGVAAIRKMKEDIESAKGRDDSTFNVKIGSGGIRDIEFICQALQLVHGGRVQQVRGRSTQASLSALAAVGVLPSDACEQLLDAYRFLRRIENRLQMDREGQVYNLPGDEGEMARIARAMDCAGKDPVATFEVELATHRERVEQIFAALFKRGGVDQILDLFQRNVPGLLAHQATRSVVEEMAEQFARSIEHSASPERATNNLDRFIRGVGQRKFFYELLIDRPELVPRLTRLFAGSEHLSNYVATHPRLIEPLFDDPDVLLHTGTELRESFQAMRAFLAEKGGKTEPELSLDALRLFHNRELVNVGLLDMDDRIPRDAAERSLTEIAEICVAEGLDLAKQEVGRRGRSRQKWLDEGAFLVVAMGKLASREMTYGSDLDVIFLYDLKGGDDDALVAAQAGFVGLAQKLIWALQTRTTEGICYEIDARLRPSGNQGLLVSHLESFESYHATSAQPWERQALLRSRPLAGDRQLASAFERLREKILLRPPADDTGAELHRVRQRMESELARETGRRRDFKTGRGGILDVESVVQFLQLSHAVDHRELVEVRTIAEHLDRLEQFGLLGEARSRTLREGWEFLQRLSARLRIVENRSISDLDEERGDLDELARRLGYEPGGRESSARRALLDDYKRHTAAIRQVYLEVLGVSETVEQRDAASTGESFEEPAPRRRRRRTAADALRKRRR